MLISIHSFKPLPTAEIGPKVGEDAIWLRLGEGKTLQLGAEEAAHVCAELEKALAELDLRDGVRATELDLDPLASLPLFDDVDA